MKMRFIIANIMLLLVISCYNALKTPMRLSMAKKEFGDTVNISIRLPTRSKIEAVSFLCDTDRVVRTSWRGRKFDSLGQDKYKLYLETPLPPGFGTLEPSIIVAFKSDDQGGVSMESLEKELRGSGPIFGDSTFADSFNVEFSGGIRAEQAATDSQGRCFFVGQVSYSVSAAEIPGVFRSAPDVLLDGTISAIKKAIALFAVQSVTSNITTDFKEWLLAQRSNQRGRR
jgi:hypothetical protein